MHARAVRIDGYLRRPFRLARAINWLTNNKPPSVQTWMFARGDHTAFDSS